MRALPREVDVLVVGAGTAGVAVLAQTAERGLRSLAIEPGPEDGAGAHWLNGVPAWMFDEAGVARPTGPELRGSDTAFHMLADDGPERIVMHDHGLYEVDMKLLRDRLALRAREAGATIEGGVTLHGLEGPEVRTSRGTVRAQVVVDASGLTGARLLDQPRTPRRDLCAAAHAVHRVRDRAGAAAFLERYGVREGDTLSRAGVAGGYSILNTVVRGDEVALLSGTIPADGHVSGRALLDGFVETQPWIGERVSGAARAIPLGRAHDVIARGHIAAVGDAARQVFSAHGSGIGAGLVAARMLARSIAEGSGPEAYGVEWQRTHGGPFALYDLFRRFSQDLTRDELRTMMNEGLLDAHTAAPALVQKLPRLGPRAMLARAPALAKHRTLSRRLSFLGGRAALVLGLYAAYPARGDRARWAAAVGKICGDRHWWRETGHDAPSEGAAEVDA